MDLAKYLDELANRINDDMDYVQDSYAGESRERRYDTLWCIKSVIQHASELAAKVEADA
jgi:hypothetical protein